MKYIASLVCNRPWIGADFNAILKRDALVDRGSAEEETGTEIADEIGGLTGKRAFRPPHGKSRKRNQVWYYSDLTNKQKHPAKLVIRSTRTDSMGHNRSTAVLLLNGSFREHIQLILTYTHFTFLRNVAIARQHHIIHQRFMRGRTSPL